MELGIWLKVLRRSNRTACLLLILSAVFLLPPQPVSWSSTSAASRSRTPSSTASSSVSHSASLRNATSHLFSHLFFVFVPFTTLFSSFLLRNAKVLIMFLSAPKTADLDDTLYPLSSGISSHVKTNIEGYMVEKLGIEESKIENLGNLLYKNYGTTMAGLRAIGYNFDYDEYHRYTHDMSKLNLLLFSLWCSALTSCFSLTALSMEDYPTTTSSPTLFSSTFSRTCASASSYDPFLTNKNAHINISRAPELMANELLTHLFQIFTNGDMIHAVRALKRLGLEDCFEGIICFETLNPPCLLPQCDQAPEIFDIAGHFARSGSADDLPRTPVLCKPNVCAMEAALRIANVNPYKAVSLDGFSYHKLQHSNIYLHHFSLAFDRQLTKIRLLLTAVFLRRQRAQHSGRQANWSPHSAGKSPLA